MSYTLTVTNGSSIVVQNGTIDTSTSLQLVGKNYPSYGLAMNQNLVNLLQSSAGTGQPAGALTGQLWWDTTHTILKVYTGTVFKNITSVISSASQPASAIVQGDLWFDSSNLQLYVYTGTAWLLVGPSYSSTQQKTTAVALNIVDNVSATHTVLAFYVGNVLTGILSKDAAFTPATPISGFATVNPGYNINSTIFSAAGILINGTLITNAQPYITSVGTLSALTVSGLLTSSGGATISGALTLGGAINGQTINGTSILGTTIGNTASAINGNIHTGSAVYAGTIGNSGATFTAGTITATGNTSIGTTTLSGYGKLAVIRAYGKANGPAAWIEAGDSSGTIIDNPALILNDTSSGASGGTSLLFRQTNVASPRRFAGIWGVTSSSGNGGSLVLGTANSDNDTTGPTARMTIDNNGNTTFTGSISPSSNASITLGSASAYWSTVYGVNFVGTSITAKYADLAENYISDTVAEPNAIMVIGGDEEVTVSTVSHDPRVIGVMSQNPAYLMNSEIDGIGSAIALAGRVPVRVKGPINRGDCVVSSDIAGVGEKLDIYRYAPGCIVGKALVAIPDDSIQAIEVVIGVR